jgi:hypothetical protein
MTKLLIISLGLLIILEKKPSGEVDLVFIRLETGETEKM